MAQTTPLQRFSTPPTIDDLSTLATIALDILPEALRELMGDLVVQIEDFPDEELVEEMDLETPYDLLSSSRPMKGGDPEQDPMLLMLYRRPILEYWCEVNEDLTQVLAQVILDEIIHFLGLPEEMIEQFVTD
jgi:predicted Zn-dependent protease with MMP-like domain